MRESYVFLQALLSCPRDTTPLEVCGSSGSSLQAVYHTLIYHTPKHMLWLFGRAITPPFITRAFITPQIYRTPKHTLWVFGRSTTPPGPNVPCERVVERAITPPGLSHSPPRPTLYHRRYTRYHTAQGTKPSDNIFKRSNASPGVCYAV